MAVKLSEFCDKLIWERKIVRANKGSSIIPLMMVRLTHEPPYSEYDWTYQPSSGRMLVTVCRRTGTMFLPRSNDKLYSAGVAAYYSGWWKKAEVVRVKTPCLATRGLLEVYIRINLEIVEDYGYPNPW